MSECDYRHPTHGRYGNDRPCNGEIWEECNLCGGSYCVEHLRLYRPIHGIFPYEFACIDCLGHYWVRREGETLADELKWYDDNYEDILRRKARILEENPDFDEDEAENKAIAEIYPESKSAESFAAEEGDLCPECERAELVQYIAGGNLSCPQCGRDYDIRNAESFSTPNCSHKWKTNEAIIANKGLALYVDIVCENCGDETRGWYSFVRKFSDLDALDPKWAESFSAEESEDESVKIEISNPFSTGFFAAIGVAVGLVTTAVAGALIVAGAVGNE